MTVSGVDLSEVNRALAKALAYKKCGDDRQADEWARKLVKALRCGDILSPAPVTVGAAVSAETPTAGARRLRPVRSPVRRRG